MRCPMAGTARALLIMPFAYRKLRYPLLEFSMVDDPSKSTAPGQQTPGLDSTPAQTPAAEGGSKGAAPVPGGEDGGLLGSSPVPPFSGSDGQPDSKRPHVDTPLGAATKRKWLARLCCVKAAHYVAANKYESRYLWIGFFLIVASATGPVLALFLAQLGTGAPPYLSFVAASVGGFATVLAGMQTFRRDGERAERHRKSGADHAYLEMRLERLMMKPTPSEEEEDKALRRLFEEWGRLTGGSPAIPRHIYAKMCSCHDDCLCGGSKPGSFARWRKPNPNSTASTPESH